MSGPDTRRDSDLERIEAALAEGAATAADPRERELQELALALRADSPQPRPEFAHELGRRVGDGFAKPAASAPRARLRRLWVPAFAGAAALIVVAVIALGALGGADTTSTFHGNLQTGAAASSTPGVAASPRAAAPFLQTEADRRVERGAQLTISTTSDKMQTAADGVGTVAESHHGFVLSSQVNTGDAGNAGGSFVLRVPAGELQATLADLSKLGHLRARSESGQDMTSSFNSVQDRLGNALVERTTLRLRLRHAKGSKADSIRARLVALNAAVRGLSSRMHELRSRTSYSTVSVTLQEDRAGAGAGGGGGTGAAWHDAVHTLETLLNFAVRALGVLLPLGLVAGLAGLGGRALRRRRRETALG
ncbi:MAG: hypothetical protein QOC77_2641 [Thermoleophilaceae bacterium]|jgi:hypothetical protein|nr:hypothetical protein [Thermoleophilaceae bacterium]